MLVEQIPEMGHVSDSKVFCKMYDVRYSFLRFDGAAWKLNSCNRCTTNYLPSLLTSCNSHARLSLAKSVKVALVNGLQGKNVSFFGVIVVLRVSIKVVSVELFDIELQLFAQPGQYGILFSQVAQPVLHFDRFQPLGAGFDIDLNLNRNMYVT